MFVSKEHHPQLLDRESYSSQEQFDREMERLFRGSWHCVGVLSDLPREGSFATFELLGEPILLWRTKDGIHAYLNVCAHRYCKLTDKPRGALERLKCQYHGWEYDPTGNVRRIPDARAFRPLEPGMLGLKQYRAALCGELIFVSLADDPPELREFLGDAYDTYEQWFTSDMHTAVVCTRVIEANWKVLVENALESYHTTEVHPKTFGQSPPEEDCRHELQPRWTALRVGYENERSLRQTLDRFGHWMAGETPAHCYRHVLHYPNVMFSQLSLYRWFECVIPLSPSRSLSIVRVMCRVGRRGPLRAWNAFWIGRWAKTFLMRVGAEDAAILPSVQQGLAARDQPQGGLISTREERIFHFQRYVQAAAGEQPRPALNHKLPTTNHKQYQRTK